MTETLNIMTETLDENDQKAGHFCKLPLFVRQSDTRLNFTVILLVEI
jgi:hypothetical protein